MALAFFQDQTRNAVEIIHIKIAIPALFVTRPSGMCIFITLRLHGLVLVGNWKTLMRHLRPSLIGVHDTAYGGYYGSTFEQ